MKKSYLKPARTVCDVMTLEEAAEYLRISRPTLLRGVKQGRIPVLKAGALYRFSRAALEEAMKTTLTLPAKIPKVDGGTSRRRKGA